LRRSIFGDYPTRLLSSASAVCVYLEGAMMRAGSSKTRLTVNWFTPLLRHSRYL
jgi:hypothetical protein